MFAFVTASLLASALSAAPQATADGQGPHRFELVSLAYGQSADGTAKRDAGETCLYGRHDPGLRVLLLSEKDSKTCPAMTGRVGEHLFHGECTVLVGADKCDGRFTVGVIGARGAYRLVEGKALSDEKAQASLLRVVAKGRAVEAVKSPTLCKSHFA
jgi:hypothetical protein